MEQGGVVSVYMGVLVVFGRGGWVGGGAFLYIFAC